MYVFIIIALVLAGVAYLVVTSRGKDNRGDTIGFGSFVVGSLGFIALFAGYMVAFEHEPIAYLTPDNTQVCTRESVEVQTSWYWLWSEPEDAPIANGAVTCVAVSNG